MLLRTSPPKPAGVRRAAGRMSAVLALIAATLWLAPAPAAQAAVPWSE